MIFLLTFLWINSFCQIKKENTEESIFIDGCIEFPAKYIGGQKAIVSCMLLNMEYPSDAEKLGIEGKVIVQFIVDTFGRVKNIKINKGIYLALNNEALRLTKLLSNWMPATRNGKKIDWPVHLPFVFAIGKEEIKFIPYKCL